MILFFDTETTGLPDNRMPIEWEGQPHLVQLAALLMEDDGTERASLSVVIEPNGWTIPDGAAKVHGITTDLAQRIGVPLYVALEALISMRVRARVVAAHNAKFDADIIRIAMARSAIRNEAPSTAKLFCTCEASAPIVNLPPTERMIAAGINKPKAPKLEECIKFFFNEDLAGAHDALVDVRACARIYFELKRRQAA